MERVDWVSVGWVLVQRAREVECAPWNESRHLSLVLVVRERNHNGLLGTAVAVAPPEALQDDVRPGDEDAACSCEAYFDEEESRPWLVCLCLV